MKYSSHTKWLSSLSSTSLYNGGPVLAETRGIVTRRLTHIWSRKDSLGVEEPWSAFKTTSHAGLLAFLSTMWVLALSYARCERIIRCQAARSSNKRRAKLIWEKMWVRGSESKTLRSRINYPLTSRWLSLVGQTHSRPKQTTPAISIHEPWATTGFPTASKGCRSSALTLNKHHKQQNIHH